MPFGPLAVTAVLGALDWAAWEWATAANHPTLGLIAGLLMAPIAVGFAWSAVRVLLALAQLGLRRAAAAEPRPQRHGKRAHQPTMPFDIEAEDKRIAA